jgi:hypothetical protein
MIPVPVNGYHKRKTDDEKCMQIVGDVDGCGLGVAGSNGLSGSRARG